MEKAKRNETKRLSRKEKERATGDAPDNKKINTGGGISHSSHSSSSFFIREKNKKIQLDSNK